jgi:manganese/zinc/iron transport system substrate-binding protein
MSIHLQLSQVERSPQLPFARRNLHPLKFLLLITSLVLAGCKTPPPPDQGPSKIHIVATTSMIADTAQEIGGELVRVQALMGPGIDPHTYKASEGDVERLGEADLILYNGLHLEARMTNVFEKMREAGRDVVAVSKDIPEYKLISIPGFEGQHDPHIWMDPDLWSTVASTIAEAIIKKSPKDEKAIRTNLEYFQGKLRMLNQNIHIALTDIPKSGRVLVTAHDAFNYFGRAYNFEVKGLQGVSTASEAGAQDVQKLANFIVEHKIPAIFIESSVPKRNVEALQEAVRAKGFDVHIGRPLYSDSVGDYGTAQSTYIGMLRFNAGIIAEELTPKKSKK